MLENGTGDEDELILPIFFFFSLFFLNNPPHYLLHFAFPIYTFSFPFLTLPGSLYWPASPLSATHFLPLVAFVSHSSTF